MCVDYLPPEYPIRLRGGTYPYEGRVEINYNGTWGTVCDDIWDTNDGDVSGCGEGEGLDFGGLGGVFWVIIGSRIMWQGMERECASPMHNS